MTKEDKADVRQMLEDLIEKHAENMNGRFNVLHTNLIQIKEQVTTANGRTRKLEDAVSELKLEGVQHILKCPNGPRIKQIEDNEISRKAVWKFVVVGAGIVGATIGFIFEIFKALK